ncbi:hypothetical protein HYS00_01055 [Candidatus Microgenomates bacterium]|nr:hypothetical protein [Candidatus Microgenomates bacterium]
MKRIKKGKKTDDQVFQAESLLAYDEYEPTVGSSTGLVSLRSLIKR